MVVNLSVDTSSVALMEFAKDLDAFYIDTVVEPWPGLYTDRNRSISAALELCPAREPCSTCAGGGPAASPR